MSGCAIQGFHKEVVSTAFQLLYSRLPSKFHSLLGRLSYEAMETNNDFAIHEYRELLAATPLGAYAMNTLSQWARTAQCLSRINARGKGGRRCFVQLFFDVGEHEPMG